MCGDQNAAHTNVCIEDAVRSSTLAKLQDVMRILGCDDEERLAEWPALKKIPLEIFDQAATYAIQLLAKLITSVSGSPPTPPEERRTLLRMVGELVVADEDGLTVGESNLIAGNLTSLTIKGEASDVTASLGKFAFTSRRADFELLKAGASLEPPLTRKLVENQIEYFGKVGMSLLGAMIMSAPSAGTAASASSSAQSPTNSVVAENPESRRSLHSNNQSSEVSATRSNVAGSAESEYDPESRDHNGAESSTGADGVGVSLHFVDMIVNNGTQDLFQVISCMEALIIHLHEAFPEATGLVPVSDNASVFASGEWIPWVIKLTRKYPHLRVSRYMNTEAQTGRDMLDAHFSFLNRKVSAFVTKDNAVQTPVELFSALTDDGGVANTTTLLVIVDLEKAEHFNNAKQSFSSKIRSGVRRIHDTIYDDACATVCSDSTPMCRVYTNSGVPNGVMTGVLDKRENKSRFPPYVCPQTFAEQIVGSVGEKTLSSEPHAVGPTVTPDDKLTGVEVLKKITSLKEVRLRKSLSEALATERTTDIASSADCSPGQNAEVGRCVYCSKRYASAVALEQHQLTCTKYVFRDKAELIVAALQEFFTSSKQTFAETRSRSVSDGVDAMDVSPRRSRKNWTEKDTVNEFASLPHHLREAIQAYFTEERKRERKVRPQDIVAFLTESVVRRTDWEARFLLTEQRLKTELSRLSR
ncbi:hypothetical protein PR001_g11501 [Phytophthora rubi]|uniref:Uncharacterized protein n=1 Tax=Phytophthora rubi TaxID=129364 RepID=A0A6A3MJD9_9STRA|nr:hypothetical protein PR001_g11501 [Phytophthora rubi]